MNKETSNTSEELSEGCDSMVTLGGKLSYLGMARTPTKNTFNDGLNKRSEDIFEKVYFSLIAHLLLTVLKRKTKTEKAFSKIATLIRIHFISHLDLY